MDDQVQNLALPDQNNPPNTVPHSNSDLEDGPVNTGQNTGQAHAWSGSVTRTRRLARGALLGSAFLFAALELLMFGQILDPNTTEVKRAVYSDAQLAFYIIWIVFVAIIVVCFHDYLYRQSTNISLTFLTLMAIVYFWLKLDVAGLFAVIPLLCDISLLGPITPSLIRTTLPILVSHFSGILTMLGGSSETSGQELQQ